MSSGPTIRKRNATSRRRRDGLIRFAKDITSQNGEDGIIQRIFDLVFSAESQTEPRWCVDVGAWDGQHLSNTYSLMKSPDAQWKGVFIEADAQRFEQLRALHEPTGNLCLNRSVSSVPGDANSLVNILDDWSSEISLQKDFDFLCIDIDGSDYWVLHDLWQNNYRPKVVCVEFNPTMPDDLIYIPERNDTIRHGASLSAMVELASNFDYVLVETTLYNAFFVDEPIYSKYLAGEVPDTSIEALHETTMGTSLYQLYDGTIKLWGCKKLLWHRLSIDEDQLQVLPPERRDFPFAPPENAFDTSTAVDMRPYCEKDETTFSGLANRKTCAQALLKQLKHEGFCFVRGTGIPKKLVQDALAATNSFLHQAHENVRRSCLTKDRARRGYSPMNVENFASLIGAKGPNDLVRKFRIGPLSGQKDQSNSLLQPNIWPSSELWDEKSALFFRARIEVFYEAACEAAQHVLHAICDGLVDEDGGLKRSLDSLATQATLNHTSILTLLGYSVGSRHKGKNKGPLVAPHTDVGVITFLVFDNGNCASLQRSDGHGSWKDVSLPPSVLDDPVFVVNVADCLSDLSGGCLPSTLHQVVAKPGQVPRNCCALFVGLSPDHELTIEGKTMTYHEWRKRRIARAQSVMRS